jgi:hypothetical protein
MANTQQTSSRADHHHEESAHAGVIATLARFSPGVAVAAIWVPTLVFALFAPDLVTGSQQEHLPLGGLVGWLWAGTATGYVLMATATREATDETSRWFGFELSVLTIWVVVALAGIFAPVLVTGTDPTRLPLAALVAPIAGMVATGFVALHATTSRR